tara:strand:+ start:59 stop:319 length:261 start_codon:yes stop_codon:yes gene_type:complete
MDINLLISIIKRKIQRKIVVENIAIEDKSFLHKNHPGNQVGKFHLKITIQSKELSQMNKINSNKLIYKTLDEEMNQFIHSLQIFIV